jgi:HlyD family type I secretion membrane fusion protein
METPAPARRGREGTASSPRQALRRSLAPLFVTGALTIAICIFGAFTWAARAPLSSAAIASGFVSPDSSRKTVQHLEGGIIQELLVKEGDVVTAGTPLIRLETTQARANFAARREQWLRLKIMKARLDAHEAGRDVFELPPDLAPEVSSVALIDFFVSQRGLFEVRRRMLIEREQIYGQQIKQLNEEIRSKKSEVRGLREQLEILEIELKGKKLLADKDLLRKPDLYALQRIVSATQSRIDSNTAEISRAEQKIEEIRLLVLSARSQFRDLVEGETIKVNAELAQLQETMTASSDVLKRTDVIAPVSGAVLNMRFKTVGGVLKPGEAILDILPRDDDLIIDARLAPLDIEAVRKGMKAEVQLAAYAVRHTPLIDGVVSEVSADALTDAQTGNRYFVVKVRIERARLDALARQGLTLTSGMPAEVFILTGRRTVLDYVADPIVRSLRRAFREA